MGLLDDAIREHLDLKRKRGSDPEEIERLEHEALGPVRRTPVSTGAGPDAQHTDEAPYEQGEAPFLEDEPETDAVASNGGNPTDAHEVLGEHGFEQATEMHRVDETDRAYDARMREEEPPRRRGFLGLRRAKPAPEPRDSPEETFIPRRGQRPQPVAPEPVSAEYEDFYDEDDEAPLGAPDTGLPLASDQAGPPALTFESEPPKRPRFPNLPSATGGATESEEDDEFEDADEEPTMPPASPERVAQNPPTEGLAAAQSPDPKPAADDWSEETQLFDVPGRMSDEPEASEPAIEDEDVLEETPEFLQDTPDHDRLWFEQKPPRDFDFDG